MTIGIGIGVLLIMFILWLLIPDKKGDLIEKICVSIYEVLLEKNPEITLEESKLIIYEVIVIKKLSKRPLKSLVFLKEDIDRYLKTHGTQYDISELKRIVEKCN